MANRIGWRFSVAAALAIALALPVEAQLVGPGGVLPEPPGGLGDIAGPLGERIDDTVLAALETVATREFQRLSYTEAIELREKSGEKFEYPVRWGAGLQAEHERYLTEKKFNAPVILYDYPREIKRHRWRDRSLQPRGGSGRGRPAA